MPERIQLLREKGWRKPPNTVKVDRHPGSKWGNPWRINLPPHERLLDLWGYPPDAPRLVADSAAEAVEWFEVLLAANPPHLATARLALAGRSLACWCKPGEACHADVLLRAVNADA